MIASGACPPSLTGSWPRRPATPTSQRLGPLQGMPDARPITLIRIGPRGAAGERFTPTFPSLLLLHQQTFFSASSMSEMCQEETHAPQQDGCLSCHKVRPRQLRKAVIGNADLYSYSRQKMQIAPARYPRFCSRLSLDASENGHSDLRSIDQSPPLRYP